VQVNGRQPLRFFGFFLYEQKETAGRGMSDKVVI
jgi:hypothetical protein